MDTGLLLKTHFDVVADEEDEEDEEDEDEYGITFLTAVFKVPSISFCNISRTIRSRAALTGGLHFGKFFCDQSYSLVSSSSLELVGLIDKSICLAASFLVL